MPDRAFFIRFGLQFHSLSLCRCVITLHSLNMWFLLNRKLVIKSHNLFYLYTVVSVYDLALFKAVSAGDLIV